MSATTQERPSARYGASAIPDELQVPMSSAKIWGGSMVAVSGGYLVNVTATPNLTILGKLTRTVDNSAGNPGDASGAVEQGVHPWLNSSGADLITQAHVGLDCYAVDNQTVALTNGSGKRSRAGVIVLVDADGVWVLQGISALGLASLTAGTGRRVRGVVASNVPALSAFTVAGNDGLTYAEGQRILLANQTTPAECGIYVVGTVTGSTAPLTRASEWALGSSIPNGILYEASEGTLFAGSQWKALCTGTCVVGTDDPLFYPRVCKGILTLAAGTKTLGSADGLFLYSTANPFVVSRDTPGGTVTSTILYQSSVAGRTAGKSGVAAATVIAAVAAGTINNVDTSTVAWLATNW